MKIAKFFNFFVFWLIEITWFLRFLRFKLNELFFINFESFATSEIDYFRKICVLTFSFFLFSFLSSKIFVDEFSFFDYFCRFLTVYYLKKFLKILQLYVTEFFSLLNQKFSFERSNDNSRKLSEMKQNQIYFVSLLICEHESDTQIFSND